MADLSGVTDNYFTIASETFTDNLSASIAALATTVPVNNNSEYTNGDSVVLTVDPGTVNEATFIGEKSGLNFINCVWTEGNTGVGHSGGATIIDYDSATHHNAQTKGIKEFANSDGTLKAQPIRDALGLSAASTNGWEVFPYTFQVSSGYNLGQSSYELTVANQDVTSILSLGTRLRLERSVVGPTQCTDLERGSSQFATLATGSVTGVTFTDDFTVEAWIKPESLNDMYIAARHSGTAGWYLRVDSTGSLRIVGRTSADDSGVSEANSVVPGIWQHVAASLDMSGASAVIYINGISVPVTYTNGANTSLTNTGPLQIGALNSTNTFDGKIADVRIWSAVRTQTEIRDNMNQLLTGSETNLVAYYKLNGDFNDSTANANNLAASGSAVATNLDNPFADTQYAIVTKLDYSAPNTVVTVYTGNANVIPNMTLNSPFYSGQKIPYNFPAERNKWYTEMKVPIGSISQGTPTGSVWYNIGGVKLPVPIGAWDLSWKSGIYTNETSGTNGNVFGTLSKANNTEDDNDFTACFTNQGVTGNLAIVGTVHITKPIQTTVATDYFLNIMTNNSDAIRMNQSTETFIRATCAYL